MAILAMKILHLVGLIEKKNSANQQPCGDIFAHAWCNLGNNRKKKNHLTHITAKTS